MKRIGILGGSFNPVHYGHLVVAQVALEKMDLHKVYFVPSYIPPHKTIPDILPVKDRVAMVRLAIKGNRSFEISDVEIERKGKSYSIDTVRYFHQKYPDERLYFIVGGDMLSGLDMWKDIDEIFKLVSFIVVNRPGNPLKTRRKKCRVIPAPGVDISSSQIRENIAKNQSVKYLVPDDVNRYIKRKGFFKKNK